MKNFLFLFFILFLSFSVFIFYAKSPNDYPAQREINLPPTMNAAAQIHPFFTLISYNMGYASGNKNNRPVALSEAEIEKNLSEMNGTLWKLHADVIALQEVDLDAARTFHIDQMNRLALGLQIQHMAYAVTWNKRYVPWPYWPIATQFGKMISGQAVLSRYPIVEHQVFDFPKPRSNPFWYNWFYIDRKVQKVVIEIAENRRVTIWNVHLEAFDEVTRTEQTEALIELIRTDLKKTRVSQPTFVLGDFNSPSDFDPTAKTASIKKWEKSRKDIALFLEKTGLMLASGEWSIPSWKPVKKIDHIFYDGVLIPLVVSGTVTGIKASDHLPVWGSFELAK